MEIDADVLYHFGSFFFFFFQSLNSLNRANCSARANYLQSQIPQIQRKARGHRLLATENAIHRHKLNKTESNLSPMLDVE